MENTSPKEPAALTVVIPVYNVEKYVAECLQSVLSQAATHHDLRVIIVVDGATDRTLPIAQEIVAQSKNPNIKIIQQNNLGLSSARNHGLENVETEYVTFLDGDDYWLPGYLNAVIPALTESAPDILEYDALLTCEDGRPFSTLTISSGQRDKPCPADKHSFLGIFRNYAWARIYRSSLFHKRKFPAGRRFEDTLTTPWLYWESKTAISLGIPLIGYRQRDGSILKSPTMDDVIDLNHALQDSLSMWRSTGDYYWQSVAMRILQQACSRTIELPLYRWPDALRRAKANVGDDLIAGPGPIRKLQVRFTFVYACLLYIKRNTLDARKNFSSRRKHTFE